tara:strand:- start:556 stop:1017 length:462 start_codon:yes stop_codon:yes gene_type:complete
MEVKHGRNLCRLTAIQEADREACEGLNAHELRVEGCNNFTEDPILSRVIDRFGQVPIRIVLDQLIGPNPVDFTAFHGVLRPARPFTGGQYCDLPTACGLQSRGESGSVDFHSCMGVRKIGVADEQDSPRLSGRHQVNKVALQVRFTWQAFQRD